MLQGNPVLAHEMVAGSLGRVPVLVTAVWCPFIPTATTLWREAARVVGQTLRTVDGETEEGAQVIVAAGVAGVPCLVAAPDRLFYGIQFSASEAESILRT